MQYSDEKQPKRGAVEGTPQDFAVANVQTIAA